MKKLIFIVAYLLLVAPCAAEIIIVNDDWPYDFNNIQAAIDHSSNGDFIFVFPGTYTGPGNYDIDFLGKAITVQSVFPTDPEIIAETIIDCNGYQSPCFIFENGEDHDSVLAGFTIKNSADWRGSIYCNFSYDYQPSTPTIINCTITGNSAGYSGIYCDLGSSPVIINCTITDNNGPGVYCGTYAYPLIIDCTITDNNSPGIICDVDSSATITDCMIASNTGLCVGPGTCGGGGILCYSSSPKINNCIITGHKDGGILCYQHSNPTITDCTITGNTADGDGGGIYCNYDSSLEITNCTITENTADEDGGGIYCNYNSSLEITDCIITGNSAGRGGSIYYNGADESNSVEITNSTVADNFAQDRGGGIWCEDNASVMENCIVWGNADSSGQSQSAQIYDGGEANVWFSCIQDDDPNDDQIPFGEDRGNIDDDPCFIESGFWADANDPNIILEPDDPGAVWYEGDYHLLAASPCIETGNPYFTYYAGDVDMDDQPRLMGQYVDMGADEFELSIIVVTKPQTGDIWAAGSTHQIKWDSYDVNGTVDISYSTNNGADWIVIDSVDDTGNFLWNLPAMVDSNQCIVAVEPNVPLTNLTCIPSGLFTIHPDSPGPPVASKWKSLGGDFDRTGLSENFGPELGCIKWQFQTDGPVSASPSVGANGRIHLACEDGKLYTLDANGLLLWSYDTNSPLLSSPSVGPDGSVFVGAENGKLYAINVNGNLRWTHSTDGFIYSSPAVSADGNVYACSEDGTLYALAQDGSELWTFQAGGISPVTGGSVFESPAIAPDGTVYVASLYKPDLYAIDSNTGSVKWICDFSNPNTTGKAPWPFASPVIADDGTIYQALLYDPNLYAIPGQLIADGQFITTGGLSAKYIAALDSNIWRPVGSGMDDVVEALTVYNDQLIAGGNFSKAGGVMAENIAAWNGRCWQWLEDDEYGYGVEGEVYALIVYNSKLIAGGEFTWAGGVAANHIASWNGSSWQSLGSDMDNGVDDWVYALTVYNGELIAGGEFTWAGDSITANHIARWNGSSWRPLENGMNDPVRALTVYNGQLIAAGEFTRANGERAGHIAAWDGESWLPLGLGMNHYVYALTVYNGELIAGGNFTEADELSANSIAAWDGSSWRALGDGVYGCVNTLTVYNGELIAGGSFHGAGGVDANNIAAWNGTSWRSLGSSMNNSVRALTMYNGQLIAGGEFTTAPNYGSISWSTNLAGLVLWYGPNPDEYIIWYGIGDPPEYIEVDGHQYEVRRDVNSYLYASCWSEPALGPDGTIYVSFDDQYLRAVDPNGSIKWLTRLGVIGGFTLTVGSNGLIYAASDDDYLCVIDPNGKEIARFKGDNWLSFPVITADNTMIVSDANNTVWAIGGSGCEEQTAALHRPQDLSADRTVSFNDFALIANDWLKPNCRAAPDEEWPCEEPDEGIYFTGDIDRDLYVDFADLAELADKWLSQE